ncbi:MULTISPECIES: hypothetical protein [Methylorubrum]|uniref:hypothetical protein n=1 Tax=Methylorubrum TaxID=2282523 RepID=UPI00209E7539|nr:hypothetical protein [Methylorubrum zatmanii]MCP1553444.1 hypothetical protein [Methylorubrum extorquens]MCP1580244.1 hypothetical protein [Methylorubrum extorquens]
MIEARHDTFMTTPLPHDASVPSRRRLRPAPLPAPAPFFVSRPQRSSMTILRLDSGPDGLPPMTAGEETALETCLGV